MNGDPVGLLARFGEPKKAYDLYIRSAPPEKDSETLLSEARLLTEIGFYERADSILARLRPASRGQDLIGYWRARLNALSGRHENALKHLQADCPDVIMFHRDLLRFESLLALAKHEPAFTAAGELLDRTPPPPLDVQIHETLLDSYTALDSLDRALETARFLAKQHLPRETAVRIKLKEIDLLYQLGHVDQVRDRTRALARQYSTEPGTIDAILRLLDLVPAGKLEAAELLLFCECLLEGRNLAAAKKILAQLPKTHLTDAQTETGKILQADLYYRLENYSRAAELARLKYQNPAHKRRSMLILARCYRQMGRPLSAASLYTSFSKTFPTDAKAAEALFVAAKLYKRVDHHKKSAQILEQLATDYRSSYFGKLAALQMTWSFNEQGAYAKSIAILEPLVAHSKWGNEAALYYLAETYGLSGRAQDRSRTMAELAKRDSTSFYLHPYIASVPAPPLMSSSGSLALDGESGLIAFLARLDGRKAEAQVRISAALADPADPASMPKAVDYLERGRYFLEMGFRDLAEAEFDRVETVIGRSPRLLFELAELYDNNGFAWKSVRLYQRAWDTIHGQLRKELAPSFLLLLHPLPFPVQVFENCAREGLDPHFIYALIREESKFDLTAVSRAGAQGLMQLMPGTGKHVARKLDLPEKVGENLFAPEINLAFGIWYASYLLRRCGGDPLKMLAAYNAGLTNARRWFRDGRGDQTPKIIDGITYKETRNYVKRIVESAQIYHLLYFCPDQPCSVTKR